MKVRVPSGRHKWPPFSITWSKDGRKVSYKTASVENLPWRKSPEAASPPLKAWSQSSWALCATSCFWCIAANLRQHLRQQAQRLCMRRELRGLQSGHDHLGFWHQCKETRTHTGFRLCFFSFIVVHTVLSPAPDPKTTLLPHRTQTKPSLLPSFFYPSAYIRMLYASS